METIAASRCPQCGWVVSPPVRICPRHPVEMTALELSGYGSIVSYTTLTVAPEGFKPPLHIAIVELPGGARIFCHGKETRALKIGRRVAIEQLDGIFYFASLGIADRVSLFWKRRGAAPERTRDAVKSAFKRFFGASGEGAANAPPPAEPAQKQTDPADTEYPPAAKK
jgi:acyl-CoA-associated DUF35 OB-fold domain-containing protein